MWALLAIRIIPSEQQKNQFEKWTGLSIIKCARASCIRMWDVNRAISLNIPGS